MKTALIASFAGLLCLAASILGSCGGSTTTRLPSSSSSSTAPALTTSSRIPTVEVSLRPRRGTLPSKMSSPRSSNPTS